jgi:hypothetical protein
MKSATPLLIIALLLPSCQPNRQKAENSQQLPTPEVIAVNNGDVQFDSFFLNKTMRIDYFHTGNDSVEMFAPDNTLSDGVWGGSKDILIDKLELGPYFFEVIDKDSKVLLYSRGFSSIFSEWQTIPEAEERWGTFNESMRFPWPKKPVTVIIKKRDAENKFRQIWTTDVDPSSRQVNPSDRINTNKVNIIAENGPSQEKLDIVILGDGYTSGEMEKFRSDARRLSGVLLGAEPFNSRSKDINIRSVETPAEQSGVNRPHQAFSNALRYRSATAPSIQSATPWLTIIRR